MNEFIEKLIGRLEEQKSEVNGLSDIAWNNAVRMCIYEVYQLAEEYKQCTLCYLGSPCEYQNENAMLPNELLADENGWIPVSDKLPEKAGKYLVTISEGGSVHTTVRRFNPKPKHPQQNEPIFTKHLPFYSGWERATRGVVAWKELPEPFKPKGE